MLKCCSFFKSVFYFFGLEEFEADLRVTSANLNLDFMVDKIIEQNISHSSVSDVG